ncbi:phage tail protein [uncultured Desulfobacter sp.]|uniref:phage tail protein n=1 Tax=uncultured Desulfobacter sp. TaxID=240139 RepID=UPI0029F5C14A|nr:phage tail protein [uncultured Desulfobacter sp.]
MTVSTDPPEITLPIWLNNGQAAKLAIAAYNWFCKLRDWAMWPIQQLDPETCTEKVLDVIAWGRDIDRFNGEPLSLYRLRVKYAYVNAKDAGSVYGFKRIFQRLGIGYVEIEERIDGQDWDIVAIRMADNQLSENQALLEQLVRHYGRTCRRYSWKIIESLPIEIQVAEFSNEYITEIAQISQ